MFGFVLFILQAQCELDQVQFKSEQRGLVMKSHDAHSPPRAKQNKLDFLGRLSERWDPDAWRKQEWKTTAIRGGEWRWWDRIKPVSGEKAALKKSVHLPPQFGVQWGLRVIARDLRVPKQIGAAHLLARPHVPIKRGHLIPAPHAYLCPP